jgi:chemotaxis protein MotB
MPLRLSTALIFPGWTETGIRLRGYLLCLVIAVLLAACVPQGDYLRLQADCESQLNLEKKRCLGEIQQKQEETASVQREKADLEQAFQECQQETQKYRQQVATGRKAMHNLEKTNQRLVERLKSLHQDIEKRQSIISLQSKVIRTLDDTKKTIETSLKKEIEARGIEVEDMEGRIKVRFVDRILFDSGKADLNSQGRKLLMRFAESVQVEPTQLIQVRGYTDNTPIGPVLKERFASNWELSAARALAVVHFLQREGRLSPGRLSACALGPYRPIADNSTESGRRLNRRIEIIIYPEDSPFALPETRTVPKSESGAIH